MTSDTTSDVFTYTIADANGNVSDPITVNITVNPVDDTAPIGADDSATVNEGESVSIDVTHNDSDSESGLDLSSLTVVSGPSNGSFSGEQ